MATPSTPLILQLIASGELMAGTTLSCALPGKSATVVTSGLDVEGQTFTDPTAAMRHVLGQANPADNGWLFWKLEDTVRGFTKPLEHVRVAWPPGQGDRTVRY